MGSMSIWHWIIVLAVGLLVVRRARQDFRPDGRLRQGHQVVQEGLAEDEKAETEPAKTEPVKTIDHQPASAPAATATPAETRKVG